MLAVRRAVVGATCSLVFAAPLAGFFTDARVETTSKILVIGLAAAAAAVPAHALLVLTALLPLALALQVLIGGLPLAGQWTEALMFAFVAGAAWRVGTTDAPDRERLARPALVLGVIVVTSAIVDLVTQQAASPSRPVWTQLWQHTTTQFPFRASPFVPMHETMRWLGALTLAVFVERILRRSPATGRGMLRIWFVAGAAAASFAVLRIGELLLQGRLGPPLTALRYILDNDRISVLHADENAAGSFFVLLLVPALVVGVARRRWWLLAAVCPLVATAFFFAQSRSAIGAMFLVLAAIWLVRTATRNRWLAAMTAGCVLVLGMTLGVWMVRSASHAAPTAALMIRYELNQLSLRIARQRPVFGVGLTHYVATARRNMTPDLPALSRWAPRGQNAHNNFLQILVELGATGLAAFLWLILPLSFPWRRAGPGSVPWSAEARAMGAGLAAFLVSALFGHPLLVTQVLAAFFVAVGLAAGLSPAPEGSRVASRLVTRVAVVLLILTLPWRLAAVFDAEAPLLGVGAEAGELDGVTVHPLAQRAGWRVASRFRQVSVPVRWAEGATDCQVEVWFDGRVADRVTPARDTWLPIRLSLPPAHGSVSRTLELRVADDRCRLLAGPVQFQ